MLEVLVELRKQIGLRYDEYPVKPHDGYEEGLKDGLDITWQMVDKVITKLEGVNQNDR